MHIHASYISSSIMVYRVVLSCLMFVCCVAEMFCQIFLRYLTWMAMVCWAGQSSACITSVPVERRWRTRNGRWLKVRHSVERKYFTAYLKRTYPIRCHVDLLTLRAYQEAMVSFEYLECTKPMWTEEFEVTYHSCAVCLLYVLSWDNSSIV